MSRRRFGGFNSAELLVIVLVFGVVATFMLPNRSRGNTVSRESALASNLALLRTAIDIYRSEHGGAYPPGHRIEEHLTRYTTANPALPPGPRDPQREYLLGPYLRVIPSLDLSNIADQRGLSKIGSTPAEDVAWIYSEHSGQIRPNTGDLKDRNGRFYADY